MARRRLVTGPPDFVGVGAQRCGTTWWFRTLLRHRRIVAPHGRQKELHFFDRFSAQPMRDEDVEAYHALFQRRPRQLAGEWTPRYMFDPATPPLLRRAAPETKLIVMLRDPIERLRSGFAHRVARVPQGSKEFNAIDAIERGRFATQLERLYRSFEPERVLVLQYERCRRDGVGEYQRTLRFLGLPDHRRPKRLERARGTTTTGRKLALWPDMDEALHAALDPEVGRLRDLVPDLDLALWPNFAHLG
ncbi:MAG TPA: sulfotransferase [Solirubrobacteraceae bacterium]|nr:sulfotransferase [Solirubrobacteraceae bacterium]